MTQDDGANDKCWTGICPECGGCVAVFVAPDNTNTEALRTAVQARCDWERRGYLTSFCTVGEVRSGAVPFRHKAGCSRDTRTKRAKRTPSTATASLPFGA